MSGVKAFGWIILAAIIIGAVIDLLLGALAVWALSFTGLVTFTWLNALIAGVLIWAGGFVFGSK